MEVTFKIDADKTDQLKRKTWRQSIRVVIPIVAFSQILVFTYILTLSKSSFGLAELSILFFASCSLLFLSLSVGVYSGQQSRLKFEIQLNDYGVQTELRKIGWNQLAFRTNKDGDLILFDTSISKILRWWNGQGVISVPSELKSFEEFKQLMDKATTHNKR